MRYTAINWSWANCANTEPEAWFTGRSSERLARICGACLIQPECLRWAIEEGEWGYWGGQYFAIRGGNDGVQLERVHTGGDGGELPEVWSAAVEAVPTSEWGSTGLAALPGSCEPGEESR